MFMSCAQQLTTSKELVVPSSSCKLFTSANFTYTRPTSTYYIASTSAHSRTNYSQPGASTAVALERTSVRPAAASTYCHHRRTSAPFILNISRRRLISIIAASCLGHGDVTPTFRSSGVSSCSLYPAAYYSSSRLINSTSCTSMAAAASLNVDQLEVFGKAASGSGSPSKERGDCPFSQRIYMELEEKGLPYTATYIEEGPNKPDWFMAKNPEGLMPVLRDGEKWIQDSDKIAQHLEEKYPQHSLKTPPNLKQVGSSLFPAFTTWLKSKKVDDPSKQEFLKELKTLNNHLQAHGPFIAGKEPTDSDFALTPKLRHARVALEHYMGFTIPNEYSAVLQYIEMMEIRPSFRKTDSPNDMIIQGWQKKFDLPNCIAK